MTVTKGQIAKQKKDAHQVDLLVTLIGATGIVLSSFGWAHVQHIILKVVLGIIEMDSALLSWWAVQDLYFYYQAKARA